MTAQPLPQPMTQAWSPDPLRQRLGAYTIEDVLNLPQDTPRVELVDGVMFVVPSPTVAHQDIGAMLWQWFRQHAGRNFRPALAVGIAVEVDHTLEPDVLLIDRDTEINRHFVVPRDVIIAIEVVSPSTRKRDRFTKPPLYANAGVQYFWRIEQDPVHVFAYKLNSKSEYELIGDSAELLELSEPFEIKLAISEITP